MTDVDRERFRGVVLRDMAEQRGRVLRLELTVATLIGWMVQSANSPINADEATKLLELLMSKEDREQRDRGSVS